MELKKYDKLREKIYTKDFEGRNKNIDYWLFKSSFLGNVGSIFFASFLVAPALNNTISANLVGGNIGLILSIFATVIFLTIFEKIKRLLVKNLSFDLVKSKFKILKPSILSWFIFSISIIALSFYFSLNGAMNFASISSEKNKIVKENLQSEIDNLKKKYETEKKPYKIDNKELRDANNKIREKYAETPLNYRTVRNDFQKSIDKNVELINENEEKLDELNEELENEINKLRDKYQTKTTNNKKKETKNIWLFISISTSIELLIIIGVYFREYYEYNLYILNKERLEKIYRKRDRYRAMLSYIYREGKAEHGERVMGAQKLTELVSENTAISNPKNFVDNFLRDMENLEVFVVQGKRRLINATYEEALNIINNFDDALRILKNME